MVIVLLLVLPVPALVATLIPGLAAANGLVLPLAAMGIVASVVLLGTRVLFTLRRDARAGREYGVVTLAAVVAVFGFSLLPQRGESGLEFYVAPDGVSAIAHGDFHSPLVVVVDARGVDGRFLVVAESRFGTWSREVELRGLAVTVDVPIAVDGIVTIQLIDESSATVVRELFVGSEH